MEPERIWMIIEKILIDDKGQFNDFFDQKITENDPFVKNLWKECFNVYLSINRFDGSNEGFFDEIETKIEKFLIEAPIEKQRIWAFIFYLKSLFQTLSYDFKPAFASIKSCLSFFSDDEKKSILYPLYRIQLARTYWNLNEFDVTLAEANEIKQLSVEMHFTFGISYSFQFIAYNNWRLGKYSEALENQNFLLDLWKSLDYKEMILRSFNFKGVILDKLGKLIEAIEVFESGIKICEEISNNQYKVFFYRNLSVSHRLLGNYSIAKDYIEKCILLCKLLSNYNVLGESLLDLGLIYELLGNFSQAEELYQEAFDICEKKSFLPEKLLAQVRINLLEAKCQGNLESAIKQLRNTIIDLEKKQDYRNIIFYYYSLIDLFLENNNIQEAKEYLVNGLRKESIKQSPYDNIQLSIAEIKFDIKTNNLGNALDKITAIQDKNKGLNYFVEQLQTELLLAEIYLRKFQIKNNKDFLQSAYIHIEKSIELAGGKKLNKYIILAYSLKSSLLTSEGDLEGSLDYIQATLEVAKDIGLNLMVKNTQKLYAKVKMQKLAYSRVKLLENEKRHLKHSFKKQNIILATESLDLLQQRSLNLLQQKESIDKKELGLIIFKNASERGPYAHFVENSLLNSSNDDYLEKINQIGTTYFIILGQGGSYHQGLFGPLPFLHETKKLALIFAFILPDSSQNDPRFGNKSYIYFCYVFPTEYSYIIPQEKIKELIEKVSKEISDFSELSSQFFENLCEKIKNII